MNHEQIVARAWECYLAGGSFVEEFRRLWRKG